MKKLLAILALGLLLMPAVALAQPPAGCTWDGDPCLRYGFPNGYSGAQPPAGINYATIEAGATDTYYVVPFNCTYNPAYYTTCNTANYIPDTFCMVATSKQGWVLGSEVFGLGPFILPSGYLDDFDLQITASCTVGEIDTIIATMVYTDNGIACAPECGDCLEPNVRLGTILLSHSDTLILTVVAGPPPGIDILQDSITYVETGVNPAFIPFSLCNVDPCTPPMVIYYNISSPAGIHIPAMNQSGSITVVGGDCGDVYAELNASLAQTCEYDTLVMIAWITDPAMYDTCVQLIHIINPVAVPLFTAPVVTILVLALILAAAVFMRRRAVSRA